MPIIFEPYTGDTGSVTVALPLRVTGREQADFAVMRLPLGVSASGASEQLAAGVVHTELSVFALGAGVGDGIGKVQLADYWIFGAGEDGSGEGAGPPAPNVGVGAIHLPLTLRTQVSSGQVGPGKLYPPLHVRGSEAATFGLVQMPPLRVYGRETAPTRFSTLYELPYVQSFGNNIVWVSLADGFAAADAHEADFIQALMDLMRFDARYSVSANVLAALADGMSFADIARAFLQADLMDAWIASEVLEGTAQITVLLRDGFVAGESTDALADILAALTDGFYATLTVATGADEYTAWVMTTQTKAVRRYRDFPFNSFAVLDGELWGAAADGIYRMGGTTDAGAAIAAAIRTGALDFGSQSMKGAPLVYIGATTSGELLLRVQATTIRGEDLQQTYRMVPAVTGAPREHRVPLGRGFRSVYWTFELANDTDGAAFEVHAWHVVPLQHTGKLI